MVPVALRAVRASRTARSGWTGTVPNTKVPSEVAAADIALKPLPDRLRSWQESGVGVDRHASLWRYRYSDIDLRIACN